MITSREPELIFGSSKNQIHSFLVALGTEITWLCSLFSSNRAPLSYLGIFEVLSVMSHLLVILETERVFSLVTLLILINVSSNNQLKALWITFLGLVDRVLVWNIVAYQTKTFDIETEPKLEGLFLERRLQCETYFNNFTTGSDICSKYVLCIYFICIGPIPAIPSTV